MEMPGGRLELPDDYLARRERRLEMPDDCLAAADQSLDGREQCLGGPGGSLARVDQLCVVQGLSARCS